MNAVIGSIIENLKGIHVVYEPTIEAFKGDRQNTGDAKEYTVQEFLERYLTQDHTIKKGKIYGFHGETNSIDCVILAPNHPRLITPKREVIIAEGVLSAIEVKPDIATLSEESEFHRSLLQIQSVKKLERDTYTANMPRLTGKTSPPEYFKRIPSGIFSFKSAEATKTVSYIQKLFTDGILGSEEIPDMIVTMDHGVIFYCPYSKFSLFQSLLSNNFNEYPDKIFLHIDSKDHITLVWFLIILLNFPRPIIYNYTSALQKYLAAGTQDTKIEVIALTPNESIVPK